MKKSKILLLVAIIAVSFSALALPALAEEPSVSAAAAILINADDGEVFYQHNADDALPPASTTKIMTALLVIEAVENGEISLDDSVVASENCQYGMDEESSNAGPIIEEGEVMSVRDLLYCAMLPSANEACNILAEYTAGTISGFVSQMNARAAEIGCTNTHFTNANGLEESGHYSTARDLALIAQEALHHDQFAALCGTVSYTVEETNLNQARYLTNTNHFVDPSSYYYDADVYGVKTGYCDNAGGCLVTAINRDGIKLIAVILGDEIGGDVDLRYDDTQTLFNWLYENYSYQQVLSSVESVVNVPVTLATEESVAGRPANSINVLLPNDFDMSSVEYEYVIYSERDNSPLIAPVSAGAVLGEVTVRAAGREFGTVDIVAANTAELDKSIYLKDAAQSILQQPVIHKLLVILVIVVVLYLILSLVYVVQHSRYRRSVAQARRERAERLAVRENFPDAEIRSGRAPDEGDEEQDRDYDREPGFFSRLLDNVNERLSALRSRDDAEEYDDEYEQEYDETDDAVR